MGALIRIVLVLSADMTAQIVIIDEYAVGFVIVPYKKRIWQGNIKGVIYVNAASKTCDMFVLG